MTDIPIMNIPPNNNPSQKKRKGDCKYPFASLEVGQGFEIANKALNPPVDLLPMATTIDNMRTHCSRQSKLQSKLFRCWFKEGESERWIVVRREE